VNILADTRRLEEITEPEADAHHAAYDGMEIAL
jgi:hypothetical protein